MKKIRLREVVPQFEEEEKNNLMTNPRLLCLPPELLVMVASYLDLSSYLTLAHCCTIFLKSSGYRNIAQGGDPIYAGVD